VRTDQTLVVIDAFSGDIVETLEYLGANTEQDERIMFLLPIIGAFIPSVVAYALARKSIHKRACA
jgi:undecaprenyl pyrophosphate phosphatase UppP